MTKAVLIVWLSFGSAYSSPSAPAMIDFDSIDACRMAANELEKSAGRKQDKEFITRCVDLGKAP